MKETYSVVNLTMQYRNSVVDLTTRYRYSAVNLTTSTWLRSTVTVWSSWHVPTRSVTATRRMTTCNWFWARNWHNPLRLPNSIGQFHTNGTLVSACAFYGRHVKYQAQKCSSVSFLHWVIWLGLEETLVWDWRIGLYSLCHVYMYQNLVFFCRYICTCIAELCW